MQGNHKGKKDKSYVLKLLLFCSLAFLGVQLSLAGESANAMDATSMFGKNASNDGQITICSDSLSYSQDAHKIVYQGNVLVIQTKDANIQCGGYLVPHENDQWAVYQFSDQKGDYAKIQQASLDYAKTICQKQHGCRFLAGQTLTILFDDQNKQVKDLILTADQPYVAKFYSLPFLKQKKDATSNSQTMYAEGMRMDFNLFNSILTIQDKAYVDRAGNRFSGDKVLYDTKNGLVTVPDTGKRATVILNQNNN